MLPFVQKCMRLDWKSNLINSEAQRCDLVWPASIKNGFMWAALQYKQGQGEYIISVLTVDPPGLWELGQAWSSMNFHILGRSPSASPKKQNKPRQIKQIKRPVRGLWPLNTGVNGSHPPPSQSADACSPCDMRMFLTREANLCPRPPELDSGSNGGLAEIRRR